MSTPDRQQRRSRRLSMLVSVLMLLLAFPDAGVRGRRARAADESHWSFAGVGSSDVVALAVAPSSPDIVYAGIGNHIYKSSNAGASWQDNYYGFAAYSLAIHPSNADIVYAGQFGYEVLKTVNGGSTWVELPSIGASTHRAIAIDPQHPNTVYVGIQDGWGVFKSSNGGASWLGVLSSVYMTSLAINPNNPQVVFAGALDYRSAGNLISVGGVFRSSDGGSTWPRVLSAPVNALAVDPANGQVIYAGTDDQGVLKSTDGGSTWQPSSSGLTAPSVRALAIDPTDPSILYAGTWEGGVFRSLDAGASWSAINTGLTNTYILSLAIDPVHPNILYAGSKGSGIFKWIGQPPIDAQATYAHVTDEQGKPIQGATIYRNGAAVRDARNDASTTDLSGNLVLPQAQVGDMLVALAPQETRASLRRSGDWAYRVDTSSLRVLPDGTTQAFTIAKKPGPQSLVVSAANPLVRFNLVVSIEWDATEDYLAMVERAMGLASNYLFDVTDGQMLFGAVAIYDRGEHWTDADIQISTTNIVRPHSYIGGLVAADPARVIRIGRGWDGLSGNQGPWDREEGYRTIVHEFGHYALSLYDSYIGPDPDQPGQEITTTCTGPENHNLASQATNATIMDYQYESSELSMQNVAGLWSDSCLATAQWQINHESDWETLRRTYADSQVPARWRLTTPADRGYVLAGPAGLPAKQLPFPLLTHAPGGAAGPARALIVRRANGAPVRDAIVALYRKDGGVIGQGLTDGYGQLQIYGANAGDILRAATFDSALAGSVAVGQSEALVIILTPVGKAQLQAGGLIPHMRVVAEPGLANQTNLLVQLEGFAADADPDVAVTASGVPGNMAPTLGYANGTFTGTVSFSAEVRGTGHIRATGGVGGGLLRLHSTYRLQQVQNAQPEDVFSDDGNLSLHIDSGSLPGNSAYVVVMPPGALPGPLPEGLALVGDVYDLTLSGGLAAFEKPASLRLSYDRVLTHASAAPEHMSIYRWDPNNHIWEVIPSSLDALHRLMMAPMRALGSYALLAPQGDWERPAPRLRFLPMAGR